MLECLDTFPAFLAYWSKVRDWPLERQIEAWVTDYMSSWPDLLSKQWEDYAEQNLDWREVARQRIFPHLSEWLPAMRQAHRNVLELTPALIGRARALFELTAPLLCVVYVGIGGGAGWVTTLRGQMAVLFGLESIADLGWQEPEPLQGLIAHEIGHILHHSWRAQHGKAEGGGAWWQLYEEGFAQYCQMLILGREIWHQAIHQEGWLEWCQAHKGRLAAEFLRCADSGSPPTAFFGSWFEIEGQRETGYFLGYQAIEELRKQLTLEEIALLEEIEAHLRPILEKMQKG